MIPATARTRRPRIVSVIRYAVSVAGSFACAAAAAKDEVLKSATLYIMVRATRRQGRVGGGADNGVLLNKPLLRWKGSSETKCVLELHRAAVEGGAEPIVNVLPSPVDHHEQIVARLEDPAETALESEDAGLVVVLHKVGP